MLTNRCKTAVKGVLKDLGLHYVFVDPGEVAIMEDLSATQKEQLRVALQYAGLELLDDKRTILIEKVKNIISDMVHRKEKPVISNLSDFLTQKLGYDYIYLSSLFSEVRGSTIQQFILSRKIERIKELMKYEELNLSEIASLMNYSGVADLSIQFKESTGLSPSQFRNFKNCKRSQIEDVGNEEIN